MTEEALQAFKAYVQARNQDTGVWSTMRQREAAALALAEAMVRNGSGRPNDRT